MRFRLIEWSKDTKNMFKNNKLPKVIVYPVLSLLIILITTILSDVYISNSAVKNPQVEGSATKASTPLESIKPSAYVPVVTPTSEPVITSDPNPVITCASSAQN